MIAAGNGPAAAPEAARGAPAADLLAGPRTRWAGGPAQRPALRLRCRVKTLSSKAPPQPGKLTKSIDADGAGQSALSPELQLAVTRALKFLFGRFGFPVANAQIEDVESLLGGALFLPLYKWMLESGPIYLLPTGPVSSFLVISDPEAAKHVLRSSDNPQRNIYGKGLVTEVSQFLFGDGFAVAQGEPWRVRRKVVAPALHVRYLDAMLARVFGPSAVRLADKLEAAADGDDPVDLEEGFSQMTLDVIGKALFNYEFNALSKQSPVIQAVYTALKETESRSTDLVPYWKSELLCALSPRQRKAKEAVEVIRSTTEELIARCKAMVDAEEMARAASEEEYLNDLDPSILRFLIAAREETTSTQLRDDLLSMLVAGHETTASAMTWTLQLLAENREEMAKAQAEIDAVLGDREAPTLEDYRNLRFLSRCLVESMRLYPHPPVLIRRALVDDKITVKGKEYAVRKGQDVLLSIYNIHRSPDVWDRPNEFVPGRWDLDGPMPSEQNTDYRYIPFSGGPRKCIGDQFALMEAVVGLAVILKRYTFELVPGFDPGITTGATIHTKNGLFLYVRRRAPVQGTVATAKEPSIAPAL